MIDLNDKDLLSIAKTVSEVIQEKALDKVNPKELDKKFKDRKDKDIDNDGDVDDSDEYLHKKRKAISKAIGEETITELKSASEYDALIRKHMDDAKGKTGNKLKHHQKMILKYRRAKIKASQGGSAPAASGEDDATVKARRLASIKKALAKESTEEITEAELELVQAVEELFVENFRTLATKGMGMFDKKFKLSVGQEMDYYEPKQGDKKGGVITKISGTGYSIKDDKTGKVHTFKFYDKAKAKKMLAEVDEPQAQGEKDFKDKHSVDKKDNPEDNKQV